MKQVMHVLLAAVLVLSVGACGKKGGLKSPSEMQADEVKAKRKSEREMRKKERDDATERDRAERRKQREEEKAKQQQEAAPDSSPIPTPSE